MLGNTHYLVTTSEAVLALREEGLHGRCKYGLPRLHAILVAAQQLFQKRIKRTVMFIAFVARRILASAKVFAVLEQALGRRQCD